MRRGAELHGREDLQEIIDFIEIILFNTRAKTAIRAAQRSHTVVKSDANDGDLHLGCRISRMRIFSSGHPGSRNSLRPGIMHHCQLASTRSPLFPKTRRVLDLRTHSQTCLFCLERKNLHGPGRSHACPSCSPSKFLAGPSHSAP